MKFRTTLKLLAASIAAVGMTAAAHAADIKLGFAAPLTGPQSHYGEDMQNGLNLALEEANKKGIKVDGQPAKFVLVSRDDQADPRVGVQVAQQLVDQDVVGILGHFNSGTTIPASRVYHEAGLPQIAMATSPEYTKQGYETTFRMMTSDTQQGAAVGKFMVQNLKAKKVAIIDDRTAYGQGLADEVEKAVKAAGGEVVRREYTTDKANDFTAILTNIKGSAPDAIFYGGLDAQAGPMLRQMEQLGLGNVKFFGGDALCTEKLPELSGKTPALKNVTCATGGASVDKMQGGSDWKKRYDAKFPGQFQIYSPYAYDAAMVLADAMKRANSVDPKVFTPSLAKTEHKGVTANIAFTAKGELTTPAVTLYTFKDGGRVALN